MFSLTLHTPLAGAFFRKGRSMQPNDNNNRQGKVGYIILWLLGVPIPILFLLFLIRGCT